MRRRSFSHRSQHHTHNDSDDESDSVSEAGDIGDRALPSRRYSNSSSFRLSFDRRSDFGLAASITEDLKLQPHPAFSISNSSVTPLPPDATSPISTYAVVGSEDSKQVSSISYIHTLYLYGWMLLVFLDISIDE